MWGETSSLRRLVKSTPTPVICTSWSMATVSPPVKSSPEDETHIHYGQGGMEAELALTPGGRHTLSASRGRRSLGPPGAG